MDKPTCTVPACYKPVLARKMCARHYNRWNKYGDPEAPARRQVAKVCSVDDCDQKHAAKGYCYKHYDRWKKHGDPHVGALPQYGPICGVERCEEPSHLRGYCPPHYRRLMVYGDPEGTYQSRRRYCPIENCGKPAMGYGWCDKHYRRWQRNGSPYATSRIVGDHTARFWSYVDQPDEGQCWNWTGPTSPDGYGVLIIERRTHYMPRFSYELVHGAIPEGLEPDHLCRNRACVNPDHLEPVTHTENVLRGESPHAINARKTHCIRGHEFTPENTKVTPKGHRQCKACARMRDAARAR